MSEQNFSFDEEDGGDSGEGIESQLEALLGLPQEDKPKKPRFHCAGAKRKDEDDKPLCKYKAHYKWLGLCPGEPHRMSGKARQEAIAALEAGKGCGGWYACIPIKENKLGSSQVMTSFAATKDMKVRVPISTGIPEMDKVLGGGFLEGATLMFGGIAGAGKTTILLQILIELAKRGVRSLFASGEMIAQNIFEYIKRIAGDDVSAEVLARIGLFCDTDGINIEQAVEQVIAWKAKVFILDSVNLAYNDSSKATMGSADQGDAVTQYILSFSQKKKVASMFISHLVKNEDFKGAQTAQHAVDGLLMLDRSDVLDDQGRLLAGTFRDGETIIREFYWKRKSRQVSDSVRAYMQVNEKNQFEPLSDFVRLRMARLRSV